MFSSSYHRSVSPSPAIGSQRSVATQDHSMHLEARRDDPVTKTVNLFNARLSSNAYDETGQSEEGKRALTPEGMGSDMSAGHPSGRKSVEGNSGDALAVLKSQLSEPSASVSLEKYQRRRSTHSPGHFKTNEAEAVNSMEIAQDLRSTSLANKHLRNSSTGVILRLLHGGKPGEQEVLEEYWDGKEFENVSDDRSYCSSMCGVLEGNLLDKERAVPYDFVSTRKAKRFF